jgi:hypothetical protein
MTTTDQRTALIMSHHILNDLWLRAGIYSQCVDAQQLMAAIRGREAAGDWGWRVRCDEPALAFIREHAPELTRLWPAVFGQVAVPRVATISQALAMIGQTVAGIESDGRGLRLVFESGDALLIAEDGDLDWRAA